MLKVTDMRKRAEFVLISLILILLVFVTLTACKTKVDSDDQNKENGETTVQGEECEIYLDEFAAPSGTYLEYGSLATNQGSDGNPLSLYVDGDEKEFGHGFFAHAYSVIVYDDLGTRGFNRFSAYVRIDKVIRDNDPWGAYANATVRVLADGTELYKKSGIGWKTGMTYLCVEIPDGANYIKLEITDNSGQGGVGWGDCTLYR